MKKTLLTLALAAITFAGAANAGAQTSPTPPKEGLNRMNNKYINIIIVLTI